MKKIIAVFFTFFFIFFLPLIVCAEERIEKSVIFDKLQTKGIKADDGLKFTKEPPITIKTAKKTSGYVEEADRPDVIISIDLKKVDQSELETLLEGLDNYKNTTAEFKYIDESKYSTIFIFGYNAKDKVDELKNIFKNTQSLKISRNRIHRPVYTPNDTYYYSQWSLSNINYSSALDLGEGSNTTVVAVVDNGVNITEAEINGKNWINSGEVYGNSIDDDGNGYIDDYYGIRIICPSTCYYSTSPSLISDPSNDRHGTYVSEIIAASTNNSSGIAGVCPTKCKIMAVNIAEDSGVMTIDAIYYGFSYAVNNGARIINFSVASICPFDQTEDVLAPYIDSFINTHNVPIVQAVGNNGSWSQSYCISQCGFSNSYCYSSARNQAYYYVYGKNVANKINVASINSSNQRSSWSVYDGSTSVITIAAPGENIPVYADSSISYINGTSFAAPHISGALGLVLTKYNKSPYNLYISLLNAYDSISTDYSISGRKLNLYKLYQRFPDVQPSHTFYSYIEDLSGNGVVSGYPDGLFRPSDNMTRGAMAKFIKNGYAFSTNTSCGDFPDVPPSHTFYEYITTLKCAGVIQGYPDGYFRPGETVDRGAAMKFIINGLRKKRGDDNYLRYYGTDQHFPDVPVTHTFYEFIMAGWSNSIVSGYPDGYFRPGNITDRGAMSKMVSNGRTKL